MTPGQADLPRADPLTACAKLAHGGPSDQQLVELFAENPQQAWAVFLDRYAGLILYTLRRLGFRHDEAMDRFVYVCEKLCEDGFRRLRTVRRLGGRGELVPWLRVVVRNLCVNLAFSLDGRQRLLRSIARLPELDQRVFRLHFWRGLSLSEVYEHLRATSSAELSFPEVFESLERILARLSHRKRWQLLSRLARRRSPLPVDDGDGLQGVPLAEPTENPEAALLRREAEAQLARALESLPPRQRLILQLRYEEAMAIRAIAEMLHLREREVRSALQAGLAALRREMGPSSGAATVFSVVRWGKTWRPHSARPQRS